ncbi:hypothetical protein WA026_001063 [Henosepilachna vigintioctopunctata]
MEKRNNNEIIDLDEIEDSCTLPAPIEYAMNSMQMHSSKILGDREVTDITNSAGILQDKKIGSTTDNSSIKSNTTYGQDSKSGKRITLISTDCLKYCDMKDEKFTVKLNTLNKLPSQNSVYLCNAPTHDSLNKNVLLSKKRKYSKKEKILKYSGGPTIYRPIRPKITNKTFYVGKLVQSSLQTNAIGQSNVFGINKSLISTNTSNIIQLKPVEMNSLPFLSNMKETQKYSVSSPYNTENNMAESTNSRLLNKRKRLADNGNISANIDLTEEQDYYVKANRNHISGNSSFEVMNPSQYTETKSFSSHSNDISTSPYTKTPVITSGTLCDEEVDQSSLEMNARYQSEVVIIGNSLISTNTAIITQEEPNRINSLSLQSNMKEIQNYHSASNSHNTNITESKNNMLNNSNRLADNGNVCTNINSTEKKDFSVTVDVNHTLCKSPFKVNIPSQYLHHNDGQYTVDLNVFKRINEEVLNNLSELSNSSILETFEKDEICNEKDSRIFCDQQDSTKSMECHPNCADECRYFFMKGSDWDKFDVESTSYKGFNEREVKIAKSCFRKFSMYLNSMRAEYKKLQSSLFITKSGTDVNNFGKNEPSSGSDLYFTNKIDILDKRGRKVRTEHVYNDQTQVFDYQANAKRQKLGNSIECMLSKVKPFSIVLERNEIAEEKIKKILERQEIRKKLDANFLNTSTPLSKGIGRPMIILNEKNINVVKLDEKFCTKCIVVFLKNDEDDFSECVYKNKMFIQLVEQNLIKISSPSVVKDYLTEFV